MTLAYRLEPAPGLDVKCFPFDPARSSVGAVAEDVELMADDLDIGATLKVSVTLEQVTWQMCDDCMAEDCQWAVKPPVPVENMSAGGRMWGRGNGWDVHL